MCIFENRILGKTRTKDIFLKIPEDDILIPMASSVRVGLLIHIASSPSQSPDIASWHSFIAKYLWSRLVISG
jgi:hypothetical protein